MGPLELALKYFLHPLKNILVHRLYSEGLSQQRIAKLLGISQPMVYKILSGDINYYYRELEKAGIHRDEANSYIRMLINPLINGDVERYMQLQLMIITNVLTSRKLCRLHYTLYPRLPVDCRLCRQVLLEKEIRDPFIIEFEEALKRLVNHPKAYRLIPEVGMNLVYAPTKSNSIEDFIAVPGRIVKQGFTVIPVGKPCYGCSHHTATILSMIRKYSPDIRSVIVIRYDPIYIVKLRETGLKVVETGPHMNRDIFYEEIDRVIRRYGGNVDVIADKGGYGLESVIYVFSNSLDRLINTVLTVID